MQGQTSLDWESLSGVAGRRLAIDTAGLGWDADFKRDPGPHADAPYAVAHPSYTRLLETITLPQGGAGFTVEGADVDTTTAGLRFVRKARIDKGVFSVETNTRSLVAEFPAAEAEADAKALHALAGETLYVHAPSNTVSAPVDIDKQLATEPTTAAAYLARGSSLMDANRFDRAISDFDKALALDPKMVRAWGNRGIAEFWKSDFVTARANLDKANALDPNDLVVFHGYGLLDLTEGRFTDAIVALTRAIDQKPDDLFALGKRAAAWWDLGEYDNALADTAEVLRQDPGDVEAHAFRARLFALRGDSGHAVVELDAALAARPKDEAVLYTRAQIFWVMGRIADARREVDAALAIKPTVVGYLSRAAYRDRTDVAAKLSDIDAALKLDPKAPGAWNARIQLLVDQKNGAEALADATRALALHPGDVELSLLRAQALVIMGASDQATKAFAEIRAKIGADRNQLNSLCWSQATIGFALSNALADCEAALKGDRPEAPILDSRGFVELRLGRLDEALADYRAALKLEPHLAPSLYGRGLVELKKGLKADGDADIAASKVLDPSVEFDFANYGVGP